MIDDIEQKLAQALQREVHLQYAAESQERCANSLRAELTLAKQDTANALHELRSAVEAIEESLSLDKHGFVTLPRIHLQQWLTLHAQQTKAPILALDPEAEAEQEKERMLEDR